MSRRVIFSTFLPSFELIKIRPWVIVVKLEMVIFRTRPALFITFPSLSFISHELTWIGRLRTNGAFVLQTILLNVTFSISPPFDPYIPIPLDEFLITQLLKE